MGMIQVLLTHAEDVAIFDRNGYCRLDTGRVEVPRIHDEDFAHLPVK
jgi:hypothetical protein